MNRNADAVILGGGIIGAAIAFELAKEGRRVVLLERGAVGRQASWAAAGLLTPIHVAAYPAPLASLCSDSERMYERWVRDLAAPEVEYRAGGALIPFFDDRDERDASALEAWRRERGRPVERLDAAAARVVEPMLSPELHGALLLPDVAQVRNHRLTRALAEAARRLGAEVRTESEAVGFLRVPGRVNGVKTARGDLFANETIVAAGAWSGDLLAEVDLNLPVRPVRGQMVLLQGSAGALRRAIISHDSYLIPRADGRILVGSTVEEAGFDASTTADGVAFLLAQAKRLAPGVGKFAVETTWAGLRPATPDRLPYLGRPPGAEGLIIATGHYRNGILLAPITARIVADLVAGRPPSLDLAPFRPGR
ncbi:MAG TPA: glycine oxidase ThiO [Planctomycetota bacterium]|jgi:glycine oxidase